MKNDVLIKNRKARHDYEILETYTAGLKLLGTEIKSIRQGKANLVDSYCYFSEGELYVKGMHIAEYDHGNIFNHDPLRDRKLLLSRRELDKLSKKLKDQGLTIVTLRMYLSDRGWAKLDIALAKGKKTHDKRDTLKEKQMKRDIDRAKAYK
ncbi:MAG: SsrA-binding protein SmpB [Flavobacteriia bacterium]|nr:SsrA-binding protein SmpB [Flavobacteriia bacterium]